MSFLTHPQTFLLRGKPASIVIHRNDGYCWGVVTRGDGSTFEVMSEDEDIDLYDLPDVDCQEAMINLAECHETPGSAT